MSRVFSGIRPSGLLHLGNYLGAIKNWIALQKAHDCIFAIVDYHAITTPFNPDELRANVREVALDYLAVGLDPKRATLMVQSRVPEHVELGWIFQSISPVSWFERVPTYKEKIAQHPDYVNLGLLAYPALMAADILIYKADLVPVGEDQLPHIEMTNAIARRFNTMCGTPPLTPPQRGGEAKTISSPARGEVRRGGSNGGTVFPQVKPLLTPAARIMSLRDPHKKMSKTPDQERLSFVQRSRTKLSLDSDDSCLFLSDPPEEVRRKIKTAVTDSGREIKAGDDKPALTNLLTIYSEVSGWPVKKLETRYKGKGYADFKKDLAEAVVKFLEPFQARRKALEKKKGYVERVLNDGAARARPLAQKTLQEVKRKIGLL